MNTVFIPLTAWRKLRWLAAMLCLAAPAGIALASGPQAAASTLALNGPESAPGPLAAADARPGAAAGERMVPAPMLPWAGGGADDRQSVHRKLSWEERLQLRHEIRTAGSEVYAGFRAQKPR